MHPSPVNPRSGSIQHYAGNGGIVLCISARSNQPQADCNSEIDGQHKRSAYLECPLESQKFKNSHFFTPEVEICTVVAHSLDLERKGITAQQQGEETGINNKGTTAQQYRGAI
jgi:hypothetical protein